MVFSVIIKYSPKNIQDVLALNKLTYAHGNIRLLFTKFLEWGPIGKKGTPTSGKKYRNAKISIVKKRYFLYSEPQIYSKIVSNCICISGKNIKENAQKIQSLFTKSNIETFSLNLKITELSNNPCIFVKDAFEH